MVVVAQEVVVTRGVCRQLVAHEAHADTEYRLGADVRGQPVAPADLPGASRIRVPDSFGVPITVELDDRLGIPPGGDSQFTAAARIGMVEVAEDGALTFDGQPLIDEDARRIAIACRQTFSGL